MPEEETNDYEEGFKAGIQRCIDDIEKVKIHCNRDYDEVLFREEVINALKNL